MKKLIFTFLLAINFATANAQCNLQTTISDDFESYAAGTGAALPDCWQSKGSTGPVIGVRNSAGASLSGTKYISIYTFFTANASVYIISPELSTIDGNHFADFHANADQADIVFEYGTMSDPNNVATFTSNATASLTLSTYTHITTASIPQIAGHKYFVMKITAPTMHSSIKIDDFEWNASAVTCAAPSNLSATNVTETGASISWDAVPGSQSYKTEYGVTGFAHGSGIIGTGTANAFNLAGLTAQTSYDVYITSNCGNGATSTASLKTFTTAASTIGMEELTANLEHVIYPNPAREVFFIDVAGKFENGQIQIFNLLGQEIYAEKMEGSITAVDISAWEKGIYWIQLENSESKNRSRIVVE